VLLALGTHHRVAGPLAVAGDPCTDVLVLVDGRAKVIGSAADGRQALLALHFSGDLVGAQDALDDRPRSASVVSTGPAVVRTIARPVFLRYLLDWPEAGVAISRALCARLRWATSRQLDLSGLPVLARLASVLSDLTELDLSSSYALTQPELAAMIGASEPSVHKAMRQLRADGVIETGYRKIVIRDLAALDAVVNAALQAGPVRALTEVRPASVR
jgi:CRP/FNR family cyclic AMP-dependent transcriptional regulator